MSHFATGKRPEEEVVKIFNVTIDGVVPHFKGLVSRPHFSKPDLKRKIKSEISAPKSLFFQS